MYEKHKVWACLWRKRLWDNNTCIEWVYDDVDDDDGDNDDDNDKNIFDHNVIILK